VQTAYELTVTHPDPTPLQTNCGGEVAYTLNALYVPYALPKDPYSLNMLLAA